MITVTRQGLFLVPEKENRFSTVINFFVEGITDISLVYRMYLHFDDGICKYFILESDVQKGGTMLIWDTANHRVLKNGIVNMQIKASNGSGEVFRSNIIAMQVKTSLDFYKEQIATENSAA